MKPHLTRTFKLSRDPHFETKFWDVIGLYLNPPDKALVLCCDEKSQCQALERTQPGLPLGAGHIKTRTHDYYRHGTITLFAAPNYLDGKIISRTETRHTRHVEWLRFLKQLDRDTPPDLDMHLIVDNYATHKHADVKAWLARRPRFHIHFTPTGSSWLNLVERFFADITQDAIRDGSFTSVRQLITAIEDYLALCATSSRNDISGAPKARRSLLKSSGRASRRSRPINYANFSDRTLGFLVDYQKVADDKSSRLMQCYSPPQVDVLSNLARNYAICDEWFGSAPCQTWPNRVFVHLGTSNGRVNNPPYDPADYDLPTIFNVLDDQHATWAVYNDSIFPSLTRLQLPRLWDISLDSHFHGFDRFLADAKNGVLPQYSFVEPSFLFEPNDEHPPHDVLLGEQFLWKIWAAVSTGKLWQNTLLIVTFDEHGGCPDHVPPPWGAVTPDMASNPGEEGFKFTRFGVRVPAVLISPWIEAGTVFRRPAGSAQPYDHTSILRTLQEWLSIPADAMLSSSRIAAAPLLDEVLTLQTPRSDLRPIAYPPGSALHVQTSLPPNDLQKSIVVAVARRLGHPDPLALLDQLPTRQHVLDFLAAHQVVRNVHWHE